MIQKFSDQTSLDIFNGEDTKASRKISKEIWKVARRKLDMLNAAHEINDLSIPPGNCLEKLKGRWNGFFSIRVNDQFRIIFKWQSGGANDVRIIDYH